MYSEKVSLYSTTNTLDSSLPKILCIADGPNWIFNRHITYLRKYLGSNFNFLTIYRNQPFEEDEYDLIYPLEFNLISPERIKCPEKYVTGIRSFVSWADWDFLVLVNFLVTHYQSIHVVSKQLYDIFYPYITDLLYVTHGVDTGFFTPHVPPQGEEGYLRIGWAGNRNTYVKGFSSFIEPLASIPGVELVVSGFVDHNLSYKEMTGFYESIDAYVCASSFEGSNNSLLEAAAMERAIITTRNGTVPEYLHDRRNAIFVERDTTQFVSAVLQLRDDPQLRINLGKSARESIIQNQWDWMFKAEGYRSFFENALAHVQAPLPDRIINDPADINHYAKVLHIQYLLERDLRIGHAYQNLEMERKLASCESQLHDYSKQLEKVKSSVPFKIYRRLKTMKFLRHFLEMIS